MENVSDKSTPEKPKSLLNCVNDVNGRRISKLDMEMEDSPVTGLTMNLHDSSLDTPSPRLRMSSKRILVFTDSPDTSPRLPMTRAHTAPLSSNTNIKSNFKKKSLSVRSLSNKENLLSSKSNKFTKMSKFQSFSSNLSNPLVENRTWRSGLSLINKESPSGNSRPLPFPVMEEEDSLDSGYNSQPSTTEKDNGVSANLRDARVDKEDEEDENKEYKKDNAVQTLFKTPSEDVEDWLKEKEAEVEMEACGVTSLHSMSFLNNKILSSVKLEGTEVLSASVNDPVTSLSTLMEEEEDLDETDEEVSQQNNRKIVHDTEKVTSASLASTSKISSVVSWTAVQRPPVTKRKKKILRCMSSSVVEGCSTTGDNDGVCKAFKRPVAPMEGVVMLPEKKRKTGQSNCSNIGREDSNYVVDTVGRSSHHSNDTVQRSSHHSKSLLRSLTVAAINIMEGCELQDKDPDLLPDVSGLYTLPSVPGEPMDPTLRIISCHTLAQVIKGQHKDMIRNYRIVDARYTYEYEGGHIQGAENWRHGEEDTFLSAFLPSIPLTAAPPRYDPGTCRQLARPIRDIIIFHCEFSSKRGPDMYRRLRERDRTLNLEVYPALYFPELYLLHRGYKEFWENYPELCDGGYTEMTDPRYTQQCRAMRLKSRSVNGGTVIKPKVKSKLLK